jgi:hypothetical protein
VEKYRSQIFHTVLDYTFNVYVDTLQLNPGEFTYYCEEIADLQDLRYLIRALKRERRCLLIPRWFRPIASAFL